MLADKRSKSQSEKTLTVLMMKIQLLSILRLTLKVFV